MQQMPGMGDAKQETMASATGTVTAINTADRKITFNHGPIPEIKWPAMKMEFPVVPSVDLSKVKVGDKVSFTLSGSHNSYTVQSISPVP
jgi:Cu/Ag efflux protein CusF